MLVAIVVAGIGVWVGFLSGSVAWELSLPPALLAILVVVVVVLLATSSRGAAAAARGRWRSALGRALRYIGDGVMGTAELLRAGDPRLLGGVLGYVLLDAGALAVAFRALGSDGLPLGPMLLAYSLGQVGPVVSVPGATEGGLIGVFVLYGTSLTVAAPAVLLYRAVASMIPLTLGLAGMLGLQREIAQDRWAATCCKRR